MWESAVSEEYLRDESRFTGTARGICFPRDKGEVSQSLREAYRLGIPVTVQGGRTGIAGGATPQGGLILNLERMNRIGALPKEQPGKGALLTAEPGVRLTEIAASLAGSGYQFAPDPTETTATLGGMAACNASGAKSFQYGSMRNHIEALELCLADGDALRLRRGENRAEGLNFCLQTLAGRAIQGRLPAYVMPPVKNAAGYYAAPNMDLLDLFIGSDGTLGVITGLTLRLTAAPREICGLMAFFSDEAAALGYVAALRREKERELAPAAIEYLDCRALSLLRRARAGSRAYAYLHPLEERWRTAIYTEFYGESREALLEKLALAGQRLTAAGGAGGDTWVALDQNARREFSLMRHAAPEIVNSIVAERKKHAPSIAKLASDMAVPEERLQDALRLYEHDLAAAGLEWASWGHIGDSHIHVNLLPKTEAEYARGKEVLASWAAVVAGEYGGTVSAEHGVGKLKKAYLKILYGREAIEQMRTLKSAFDPKMLLNRGNLFD